jgi:hypothetical protein
MAEEKMLGAKQVARRIGTDGRLLRKFLRSAASPYPSVGQGKRYNFPESELPRIKLYYDAWRNGAIQIDHEAIERVKPRKSKAKAEVVLGTAPTDEELDYDDKPFDDEDPLPEELDWLEHEGGYSDEDELEELTLDDLEDDDGDPSAKADD